MRLNFLTAGKFKTVIEEIQDNNGGTRRKGVDSWKKEELDRGR